MEMTNTELANWIQLGVLCLAIIGLIITIFFNRRQLQIFNKQLKLNFFADYTKRYQEIMLNFPENINDENFDFESLDKDIKNTTKRYMRAYFDLCSEEYFLWKDKNIDNKTWKEWEGGINYAFTKTAFQKGWRLITLDTIYYQDFSSFINQIIQKNNKDKDKVVS